MGFERSTQERDQGALVCREWPGRDGWRGQMPDDFFFAAGDVGDGARLRGMVTFHFACYGAGTPRLDAFSHRRPGAPAEIAPRAFLARLPQRLLSHPRGGALAVIGHVDRAWGWSFMWDGGAGSQPQAFEDTLRRLMKGYRVGAAMERLNQRYAELATDLSLTLEADRHRRLRVSRPPGAPAPRALAEPLASPEADRRLVRLWTANNDARSYVVLGDPAVRLRDPEEL